MNFKSIEQVLRAFQNPDQKIHNQAEELIHSQVRDNFENFLGDLLLKGIALEDP